MYRVAPSWAPPQSGSRPPGLPHALRHPRRAAKARAPRETRREAAVRPAPQRALQHRVSRMLPLSTILSRRCRANSLRRRTAIRIPAKNSLSMYSYPRGIPARAPIHWCTTSQTPAPYPTTPPLRCRSTARSFGRAASRRRPTPALWWCPPTPRRFWTTMTVTRRPIGSTSPAASSHGFRASTPLIPPASTEPGNRWGA